MTVGDGYRLGAQGNDGGLASASSPGRARSNRASSRVSPYSTRVPGSRRSLRLTPPQPSPEETHTASPQLTETLPSLDGNRTSMESTIHLSPRASSSQDSKPLRRSPRLVASTSGVRASINDPPQLDSPGRDCTLPVRTSPRLLEAASLRSDSRSSTGEDAQQSGSHLYQLVVRPILKTTISQRDSSGETLEDFAVNGSSFRDIFPKLWERISPRVKGRAVKAEEEWSLQPPAMEGWSKVMQFKAKRHIVDSTKSDRAWNTWLHATRGETVKLLVHEHGVAITINHILATFKDACINPLATDRAGATAEICLHEVVESLKERWESEYDTPAVVWRMWANRVTSNLDRSTWETAINRGPPVDILKMLRASESRLADHIMSGPRSSNLALNCVVASLEDHKTLRRDWDAFGSRLKDHEKDLETRKSVIEAFLLDVLPSRDVPDPLEGMENIPDINHE
ncbi:hypothetical protein PI125_g3389 [Phytophthora idaei]|nr:hypothetical protein PI125_g3389 [Phytophthora idaei]KAG3134795.1 hypothetical protein PI126_g18550 [Phytophthora idaei]